MMIKEYAFKGKAGLEVVLLERLTNRSMTQISEPHRVGFYQIYFLKQGQQAS